MEFDWKGDAIALIAKGLGDGQGEQRAATGRRSGGAAAGARGDLQAARLAFAVYRLRDRKITDVWFSNEPSDADAFSALVAFD